MSVEWYYVDGQNRVGPIEKSQFASLIQTGKLGPEDYAWREGFEDWLCLKDIQEWSHLFQSPAPPQAPPPPTAPSSSSDKGTVSDIPMMGGPPAFSWDQIGNDQQVVYIKIGQDRGGEQEVEYGPFSKQQLERALQEGRINEKTYIYTQGMDNWVFLGDTPLFQQYSGRPAVIEDKNRRRAPRKPFVARLFLTGRDEVFEGICRNISLGGLQVLVANFPLGVGEHIDLNVHPENSDNPFVASGKIVRILDGGVGFALCFDNLTPEAQGAIQGHLQNAA